NRLIGLRADAQHYVPMSLRHFKCANSHLSSALRTPCDTWLGAVSAPEARAVLTAATITVAVPSARTATPSARITGADMLAIPLPHASLFLDSGDSGESINDSNLRRARF